MLYLIVSSEFASFSRRLLYFFFFFLGKLSVFTAMCNRAGQKL